MLGAKSRNLYLARGGRQDEAEIHALLCLPEVYQYLTDGVAPSRSLTAGWVDAANESSAIGGGTWLLRRRGERALLGLARLFGEKPEKLELTYVLHPNIRGLGLATRMAHTVMAIAFASGKVSSIWAGADAPNVASMGVMRRLGMTFLRDVQYPAGNGVEYAVRAENFDMERFELMEVFS